MILGQVTTSWLYPILICNKQKDLLPLPKQKALLNPPPNPH
jgi:hypothetical protein